MTSGRWLAIVIAFFILLGFGYETFRLLADRQEFKRKEVELRLKLGAMRTAIREFHDKNGRYPHDLQELVPAQLRAIPVDPMTRARDWRLTTEEEVKPNADFTTSTSKPESYILDVHSAGRSPYSEW